jgi:signal transduction histidine kinase
LEAHVVKRQSVVIVAERADLAAEITSRWQSEQLHLVINVVSSESWSSANTGAHDLTIVVGLGELKLLSTLRNLDSIGTPSICVVEEPGTLQLVRSEFSRVLALRHHDDWADSVVVLAAEVLRRVDASYRAKRSETMSKTTLSYAALGRYILDMRHGFNNALTSVLGNAELLMIDPGTLNLEKREQVDTIHTMALRLHEMMQRFSSMEAEMMFGERQSQAEITDRSQAYVSGS